MFSEFHINMKYDLIFKICQQLVRKITPQDEYYAKYIIRDNK